MIYLGTCVLHTANNALRKLVKRLSEIVDLHEMAIDFHFFFKSLTDRREDFQDVSNVTGVLTQHLEKHCSSRSIYLDKVLVKLIEQFPNFWNIFLTTLPQLPGFNNKQGISSTARYTASKLPYQSKSVECWCTLLLPLLKTSRNSWKHCRR